MNDCKTCGLHDSITSCLEIIKTDIKDIERRAEDMGNRVSAIEPTIVRNERAIITMQKLQMGTLVSALISAVGVISGLAFLLYRHLG